MAFMTSLSWARKWERRYNNVFHQYHQIFRSSSIIRNNDMLWYFGVFHFSSIFSFHCVHHIILIKSCFVFFIIYISFIYAIVIRGCSGLIVKIIKFSVRYFCSGENTEMCILFLNGDNNPAPNGFKLILASNRDEFYSRPASVAAIWDSDRSVYGGETYNILIYIFKLLWD